MSLSYHDRLGYSFRNIFQLLEELDLGFQVQLLANTHDDETLQSLLTRISPKTLRNCSGADSLLQEEDIQLLTMLIKAMDIVRERQSVSSYP